MNCITGYLPVHRWNEAGCPPQDLLTKTVESRAALGMSYAAQEQRIFSQLSVKENLQIALLAGNERTRAIPTTIYVLFPTLYSLRHLRGGELTNDIKQQLTLARALVTEPKLLILDEPTSGSGQEFTHSRRKIIRRLIRDFGLTLLQLPNFLLLFAVQRSTDSRCQIAVLPSYSGAGKA